MSDLYLNAVERHEFGAEEAFPAVAEDMALGGGRLAEGLPDYLAMPCGYDRSTSTTQIREDTVRSQYTVSYHLGRRTLGRVSED